ncbi:hypothetical protein BDR26DRAFT_955298 [Obelidium mucronatum]|nr:hypothetical protein BDR26DRAFT_955298 [Obelidium mucronatum]
MVEESPPPPPTAVLWSFIRLAAPSLGFSTRRYLQDRRSWLRRYSALFGLSLDSTCDVWDIIKSDFHAAKLSKIHLLWCFYFLKVYPTESQAAATFSTSETNWRTKVDAVLTILASMDQICFEDRWVNWDILAPSMYVDGVDVPVPESRPLDTGLFSHKFKHAGYRFQVATAIGTSRIVFIGGGTPCGLHNDLDQVQKTVLLDLEEDEQVAADRGYVGDVRVITKLKGSSPDIIKHNKNWNLLGSRHETVNKRMKDFRVLAGLFRGRRERINLIFTAVAQITNVKLRREPLFDITSRLIF